MVCASERSSAKAMRNTSSRFVGLEWPFIQFRTVRETLSGLAPGSAASSAAVRRGCRSGCWYRLRSTSSKPRSRNSPSCRYLAAIAGVISPELSRSYSFSESRVSSRPTHITQHTVLHNNTIITICSRMSMKYGA